MIDIWEALEATATNGSREMVSKRAVVTKNEIALHRRTLLHFLEEIDGDLTVSELREALESYCLEPRHD